MAAVGCAPKMHNLKRRSAVQDGDWGTQFWEDAEPGDARDHARLRSAVLLLSLVLAIERRRRRAVRPVTLEVEGSVAGPVIAGALSRRGLGIPRRLR
jgi:hypothetical protein